MSLSRVLAECLGEVLSGRSSVEACLARYPQYADELRPMLELALSLRTVPRVFMGRQAFLRGRERVVHAARTIAPRGSPLAVLVGATARLSRLLSLPRRALVYGAVGLAIVLSLVMVGSLLGLGVARKVPADRGTFYPVFQPSPISGVLEPLPSPFPTLIPTATAEIVAQEPTVEVTPRYRPEATPRMEPTKPRAAEASDDGDKATPASVVPPSGVQPPQPTATPEPREIPTPPRVAEPTKAPEPRETPEPTRTPRPTKTVKPTETPEPTETGREEETPHPEERRTPRDEGD